MIIVMIYASQLYLQYKLFILDIKTGKLNEILAINEQSAQIFKQSAQIFNKCFHIALPVHRVCHMVCHTRLPISKYNMH